MRNIKSIVEEALLGAITQGDIEEAVATIVEGLDIADLLADNEVLKDNVYSAVSDVIDNCVEAFL